MALSGFRKLRRTDKPAKQPVKRRIAAMGSKMRSAFSAIAKTFRRKKSATQKPKSTNWRNQENVVVVGQAVDALFRGKGKLGQSHGRIYGIAGAERFLDKAQFLRMPPEKQSTMLTHLMDRSGNTTVLNYLSNRREKVVARIKRKVE